MKNNKASIYGVFFGTSILLSHSVFADRSPADVFNDAWAPVCASLIGDSDGEETSSELGIQCITNDLAGAGGSIAGAGNNGGVSAGIGNSTINTDRHGNKSIEERKQKIKEQKAAGDILSGERLGFFSSGKLTEIDRKDTVLEAGYDSDVQGFTVGMDYIFSDKFVAGIAVGYSDTDLDYNQGAGNTEYESVSVLTFANYNVNDNFIIDGYLGWSGVDFDNRRNIAFTVNTVVNTFAQASPTANKILAGLNLSYLQSFGAIQLTPLIKLDYSGTFIDDYTETGSSGFELSFKDQDIQSFKSQLGLNTSYAVSVPWGIVLPRVQGSYVHEFLDHRRNISASFVQAPIPGTVLNFQTDQPDRDYFLISGGISTVLTNSIQLFVDYERIEGHRYMNSYTVSGGVRIGL